MNLSCAGVVGTAKGEVPPPAPAPDHDRSEPCLVKLLSFSNDISKKNCYTLNSWIELWKGLFFKVHKMNLSVNLNTLKFIQVIDSTFPKYWFF